MLSGYRRLAANDTGGGVMKKSQNLLVLFVSCSAEERARKWKPDVAGATQLPLCDQKVPFPGGGRRVVDLQLPIEINTAKRRM